MGDRLATVDLDWKVGGCSAPFLVDRRRSEAEATAVHKHWRGIRVSNTPGNPRNPLEIYKVSAKFSGLVCKFVCLWWILVTILVFQSDQCKISRGKPGSIDIEVINLGKYELTHLLIGWQASDGTYHHMILHLTYVLLQKNYEVYLILVKMSPENSWKSTGNHTCWSVRHSGNERSIVVCNRGDKTDDAKWVMETLIGSSKVA